ncbi:ribonuclease H-like domain-containing protein [Tanacetum coccineum]
MLLLNPRRYLKLLKMKVGLILCRKSCCNSRFRESGFWLICLLGRRQLGQNGQEERIDYDEVFAPVARIEAIRIFLAFASYMGFIVYQMDVKSVFLYGIIDEEVYVSQPPGFIDLKFSKKITRQKEDGIFISQDKYVTEILKKFDFMSVKTASTPIETQKPLVKDEKAADVDVHLYRSIIGSLMYLTASRADIMFAVYTCSRFQGNNIDKSNFQTQMPFNQEFPLYRNSSPAIDCPHIRMRLRILLVIRVHVQNQMRKPEGQPMEQPKDVTIGAGGTHKVDHPSPMLDLSLRRCHPSSSVNQFSDDRHRLKQSDVLAFSRHKKKKSKADTAPSASQEKNKDSSKNCVPLSSGSLTLTSMNMATDIDLVKTFTLCGCKRAGYIAPRLEPWPKTPNEPYPVSRFGVSRRYPQPKL